MKWVVNIDDADDAYADVQDILNILREQYPLLKIDAFQITEVSDRSGRMGW